MSTIGRVTRASRQASRLTTGEDRIPAVWRAWVVYVRDTTAESGAPAGVYVQVPRLTGDEIHGPLPWVGSQPAEGGRVLVAAVEGRKSDLLIINPAALPADAANRLTDVEDTLGGEVYNRITAHEAALQVAEDIFEANALSWITWLTGSSGRIQIPGYVPQPIARSYRLEIDIITEGHTSAGDLWIRVMTGDTQLLHLNFGSQVNRAGDNNRYRFVLDFNAPANAALEVSYANILRNPQAGRAGYTRPVLTTPIERSA